VQLDFVQPERFGLEYAGQDGTAQRPVMIHCALLGSIERFLSVYIEHTAGRFPVWVAPEQVRLVTVNQETATVLFADDVVSKATEAGLRITVDNDNESVGKKIRSAEIWKVPYTVVIGEKEMETGQLTPRVRKDLAGAQDAQARSVADFVAAVAEEAAARALTSTL
jgi:threonyl-tRNA synthetase